MSVKSFIQILILFLIMFIVGGVYFKYFETKKNVVEEINLEENSINNQILDLEKKISQLELKNTNLNKKLASKLEKKIIVEDLNISDGAIKKQNVKEEEKKDKKIENKENKTDNIKKSEIKNFVKDVEYTSVDQRGNKFHLLANSGKTNNKNNDILDLENVRGEINSDKRDTIFITSDYAQYNTTNLNSKFYENVIIDYQDKKISCINFDINMKTNKAIAYNNVTITDPKSKMKAGIVEFDLKTKNININPKNINTEIEIISN
ncbi:LPS export ABC transporter periplasmic protein LptC [Pelagibacterales bacterium SAG-MED17]|nr:LPS export ABC transporter periplasmic protein LptC [Pelagibacterales bacterium SAG-MED17]